MNNGRVEVPVPIIGQQKQRQVPFQRQQVDSVYPLLQRLDGVPFEVNGEKVPGVLELQSAGLTPLQWAAVTIAGHGCVTDPRRATPRRA